MKKIVVLGAVVLLAPALWASNAEKEARKLDKELKKISLRAADIYGRRIVNRVMATQLGLSRQQLVSERRDTGFVYGQLFGAHEVARGTSMTFKQVSGQMREGRSLLEISEQHNLELKQILADARRLNKKIDEQLERIAAGEEDEQADDDAASYDPSVDSLRADTASFNPTEIGQARDRVHHPGRSFGAGGPFGSGRGASGGMGVGRGPGGGVGGGRGRGPR